MLVGSLCSVGSAVPVTPEVVVPLVVAPGVVVAAGVTGRSSTGVSVFSGVDEQPAASTTRAAAMIHLRILVLLGFGGGGQRGSGPHAGSRTSAAGDTSRVFTRPSEETAANIPRPPCC